LSPAGYLILRALIESGAMNKYYSGIFVMICINIILAVSLNLAAGFLGQLVLGHAGFMAVGAYACALLVMGSGLDQSAAFPLALLFGGIVAAAVGFIIGIPALRLRGDYLAIITLGFGEIIRVVILALNFTGGARGLKGIPLITNYTWVYFIAVIVVILCYTFINSRHGRAVISIREDEIAAEASGVNTTYFKMFAFVLAAFFAGIAGGLYAHHIGILNPAKFNFNYSVEILVMVVLGGMGSITGSVIAALVLTILPEALRQFADYRLLVYSGMLIAMMLFRPKGLMGTKELSITKIGEGIKRLFIRVKKPAIARQSGEKEEK
jgi:branched-chain amino acid transport system permease protein